MQRAPLLFPACALLAAVVLEQQGFAAIAIVSAGLLCAWRRMRLAGVVACAGAVASHVYGHPAMIEQELRTQRYMAIVVDDVEKRDERYRTTLAISGIGNVEAWLPVAVEPGERLAVRGRITPFDLPRNQGEPSQRDIERAQGRSGVLAAAHVLARGGIVENNSRAWPARIRACLSRRLRAHIAEPIASILAGALWGERGTLPDQLHDAFQVTGTVHVLVTAGLHLGAIAAALAFALRMIRIPRRTTCLLTGCAVLAYAWLSGAHLPSERAATMIIIALIARAAGARIISLNALALAAITVALLDPASVTSASFALSFSCVTAIVLFAEHVAHALDRLRIPSFLGEAIALTCATQLGTWPLTAAIFGILAPYALIANAIVVPLTVLCLGTGFAALVLPPLAPITSFLVHVMMTVVQTIATWPAASLTVAAPPTWVIAAYDVAMIGAAIGLHRERRVIAAILVVGSCSLVFASTIHRPPAITTITFLDVGQADAAFIETSSGRTMLIDTGGELERGTAGESSAEHAGARVVLGYLKRHAIHRIDLMLLTHPHGDHVGGCAPIVLALSVGMILDSGQPYEGRAYRDCIAEAGRRNVPIHIARAGEAFALDDTSVQILAPSEPLFADGKNDINENSIVARVKTPTLAALFMGDAGFLSESRLLASNIDVRSDVLKVGHHGSAYASSPAFIAAVSPRVAIISDGRHNVFNHPASRTIDTLSAAHASIHRTDLSASYMISDPAASAYPNNRRRQRECYFLRLLAIQKALHAHESHRKRSLRWSTPAATTQCRDLPACSRDSAADG